jgi:hypothetical protein
MINVLSVQSLFLIRKDLIQVRSKFTDYKKY